MVEISTSETCRHSKLGSSSTSLLSRNHMWILVDIEFGKLVTVAKGQRKLLEQIVAENEGGNCGR